MLKKIQRRFALSEQGARDFAVGAFSTTLLNLALMGPAVYMFAFLTEYLALAAGGATPQKGFVHFTVYALIGIAVIIVCSYCQYDRTYTNVYDESAARRISVAEKLRRLPLAFFGEKNLSDLTATIMEDCTDLEHTFSHAVPQLFASIATITLISVGMLIYQWQLALALLWVVPVAAAVVIASNRLQRRAFRVTYESKRAISDKIQEGLENIREIKSYHQENAYMHELGEKIDRYESELIRSELLLGVFLNISRSLLNLGIVTVVLVGANLLAAGRIGILTYMAYLIVSARIYDPISEVFNNFAALNYLDIRIRRMNEMQNMPIQSGETEFEPEHCDIVFEHVGFSYDSNRQVLRDVSFTAKQGEITALVGASGGGKSTAAKLAARFWDADSGVVTLGGRDVKQIDPETLLRYYSVVFQDVVLFNASVKDNIRIGNRDASDQEIERAAQIAQCDFIEKLPQGFDTVIGENGETLSGGERQRISIARAVLKNAPIVLLDEATASLDVENETKIQSALSQLIRDKTVIVIAHRMRTISEADRIVVLQDGQVVEQGDPKTLLERGGVYANMCRLQSESAGWSL